MLMFLDYKFPISFVQADCPANRAMCRQTHIHQVVAWYDPTNDNTTVAATALNNLSTHQPTARPPFLT